MDLHLSTKFDSATVVTTQKFKVLANHGLHFELLTREPTQFDCALDLVAKAPANLTIVMQVPRHINFHAISLHVNINAIHATAHVCANAIQK